MNRATPATTTSIAPEYARPWTLVFVLMVLFSYSFLDSTLIYLLADPIKLTLHLTDYQIGVLLGFAFAVFYALAILPSGYLVDRMDRRLLIGIASIVWASMTLVCAMAGGYLQIFSGRCGVGLAEAVMLPASFSLIRDAVPERMRGMAFSIYAMSPILGAATALIGGGALLHVVELGALSKFGPLAAVAPWRSVMGIAGLLGLPLGLLLFLVRDPARETSYREARTSGPLLLTHIRANAGTYALLVGYASFGTMLAFGQGAWMPTMLSRRWAMPPAKIGPLIGGVNLLCGMIGLLLTSILLRQLALRGRDITRFGVLAALCATAGLVAAALAPSLTTALVCSGFSQFFLGASFPIGATVLTQIAPEQLMGRLSAGYLLFQNLLGQSLGPFLIAAASTQVFTGPNRLSLAFAAMMTLFGAVTVVCGLGLRPAARPTTLAVSQSLP